MLPKKIQWRNQTFNPRGHKKKYPLGIVMHQEIYEDPFDFSD